jgi:hypothetical protein
LASPASSGIAAQLDISSSEGFISAAVQAGAIAAAGKFAFSDEGFASALTFIRKATNDHPVFTARTVQNEHAMHLAQLAKAVSKTTEIGQPGQPGDDTSYYQKRPDLPADFYTAKAALAHSKLCKEFVDIPVGEVKLHTWIEYPAVQGKVGTVIVMQHGAGIDDWVRAVADQLAQAGFLAVAPDVWSGTGPGGGGLDSFQFVDDAMKASARITPEETMRRFKAAREYAFEAAASKWKDRQPGLLRRRGELLPFRG